MIDPVPNRSFHHIHVLQMKWGDKPAQKLFGRNNTCIIETTQQLKNDRCVIAALVLHFQFPVEKDC